MAAAIFGPLLLVFRPALITEDVTALQPCERRLRSQHVLRSRAAAHQALKAPAVRQLVPNNAGGNLGSLARGVALHNWEYKLFSSRWLVAGGRLEVSGLYELLDNSGGVLLPAEAEFANPHAEEHLLDGWHGGLKELGGAAGKPSRHLSCNASLRHQCQTA